MEGSKFIIIHFSNSVNIYSPFPNCRGVGVGVGGGLNKKASWKILLNWGLNRGGGGDLFMKIILWGYIQPTVREVFVDLKDENCDTDDFYGFFLNKLAVISLN